MADTSTPIAQEDKALYRFLLCLAIQFFQQWCGSNLISSYSTIVSLTEHGVEPICTDLSIDI